MVKADGDLMERYKVGAAEFCFNIFYGPIIAPVYNCLPIAIWRRYK